MANSHATTPKNRKSAAVPTIDAATDGARPNGWENYLSLAAKTLRDTDDRKVPYVDEDRDYRDCVVITAIRTALEIIRHDDNDAADILQLALWKMQSGWPTTDEKFTAEVAHG